MTERDQKTLRYAAVGIAIYLVLFFGWTQWKTLEKRRTDYEKLMAEAQRLKLELIPYETRGLLIEKLRDTFQLQPGKLSRLTVVTEASAAIQKAAQTGGVQLGPLRESPGRGASKELATMQLEASGQVAVLMGWVHRLNSLGYPIVVDSVQFSLETGRGGPPGMGAMPGGPMMMGGPPGMMGGGPPGMLKAHLTIIILDFEQWKAEGAPNA